MTDDFEDLVRAAARGIGAPGELPTYHDAWRRGRRRRLIKRGALATAGAIALVLAVGTDLGRLPGGDSVEVDDVASEAIGSVEAPGATAPVFEPTAVPTTEPVGAVPDLEIGSAAAAAAPDPAAGSSRDQPPVTERGGDVAATSPTETPTPVSGDGAHGGAGQATPAPTSPATSTGSAATAAPSPAPTPRSGDPAAGPTAAPGSASGGQTDTADGTPAPEATSVDPETVVTAPPGSNAPTATAVPSAPGVAGSPDAIVDPTKTPAVEVPTSVVTGQPADASLVLVGPSADGALPCDTDGDAEPDARCQLLSDYACTMLTQRRVGYAIIDIDGDGVYDRCVPDVTTGCDVDGDGRADIACIIGPEPDF